MDKSINDILKENDIQKNHRISHCNIPLQYKKNIWDDYHPEYITKDKVFPENIIKSRKEAKDVVGPLEKTNAVDCSLCGKSKKCLTKNVWEKIDLAISKTLKSITLADLIK